jgi:lipoate-protein ligase A
MPLFSSPKRVVVVFDEPRSGLENMRLDEHALEFVTPNSDVVLRIYRWSEPTLSLGHFQSIEQLGQDARTAAFPELATIPWVRRKTGGGAILHDRELTYRVVIPIQPGEREKGHNEQLYRSVHASVRDGLIELGIPASLSEACTCGLGKSDTAESFLCFQRRTPVDVVVGQHKIMGSAQRRTRTGLLQHGSFLLRASPKAPALLGVEDLSNPKVANVAWGEWLANRIRMGLNVPSEGDC